MPTASVNDEGAVLYYEDTGAPSQSTDYTTIALVHGLIFHGAIFHQMIPYAAKNNLRLLFINLRDYPGSSHYTKAELEAFESDEECIQDAAVRDLGRQIAEFLTFIIKTEDIPPITTKEGKTSGGITLLTWSMSNLISLSLLAHAQTLPEETKQLLGTHLRSVVLHDASLATLGVSPTLSLASGDEPAKVLYSPLRDLSLTFPERVERFSTWVSAYYQPVDDLSTLTPENAVSRSLLNDPTKPPSIQKFSQEELEKMTDYGVLERSHDSIRRIRPQIYASNLKLAFGVGGEIEEDLALGNTKVVMAWCSGSMVDSVWAAKAVYDMIRAGKVDASQRIRREVSLEKLQGANHFVHWDEPERFVDFLLLHV
ncbi:hypothetical protein QCA50_015417 [Cerrena zonata]|uniref:AB hydrolase-1 domain-containing protein n=1 Tax=Cerrena zonata TaxID=2478898 RepID=A0AAW0FIZ4_9APHY